MIAVWDGIDWIAPFDYWEAWGGRNYPLDAAATAAERRMTMAEIIIVYFIEFLLLFYIPPILYFTKGWFKSYFHDFLKWHQPDENTPIWCDGCYDHFVCKYCGKEIMRDSQENWFC